MKLVIAVVVFIFMVMPYANATPSTQIKNLESKDSVRKEQQAESPLEHSVGGVVQQTIPSEAPTQQTAPVVTEIKQAPTISGTKHDWLLASGIPQNEWEAADYIISHESSWRPSAINSQNCIGLYQACPKGDKPQLLATCPDWQTNPVCTLKMADKYARRRFGNWWNAYNVWVSQRWW